MSLLPREQKIADEIGRLKREKWSLPDIADLLEINIDYCRALATYAKPPPGPEWPKKVTRIYEDGSWVVVGP